MLKENILRIRQRISAVCSQINQDPDAITIVAVSKGRSTEQIKEALSLGITDIGENRVQEAILKYEAVCGLRFAVCGNRTPNTEHRAPIRWHMVGHLQTNKAKDAVRVFDLIHSVDNLRIAEEIDKQAARLKKIQGILVEVKTSLETTKFGIKPEGATDVIKEITGLKNIKVEGLMTIAPIVENPEEARPYFRRLKELLDRLNGIRNTDDGLRILSMGMTDDFEVALEEGANMIRIGRAIFED